MQWEPYELKQEQKQNSVSRADEPLQVTQAGDQLFGKQACGKGPRLLGDSKLDTGQKCAPEVEKPKGILGCIS